MKETNINANPPSTIAAGSEHPAFKRTWWVNLYPNGQCTGTLCETRESALRRCTYTGDTPDAVQVEVRIVPNKELMGQQLATLMVKHDLVDSQAIDDPEGYDNYRTLEAINAMAREMRETPNDQAHTPPT
jgi:hypothetical protein